MPDLTAAYRPRFRSVAAGEVPLLLGNLTGGGRVGDEKRHSGEPAPFRAVRWRCFWSL
jgi:hypothetical protein